MGSPLLYKQAGRHRDASKPASDPANLSPHQELTMLTLIIFGATGDLTARKLVPSLYRLRRKGRLPTNVQVLGVARTPLDDDAFRERMKAAVQEHAASDWAEGDW